MERKMLGYILFGIGVLGFLGGLIWMIVEMILNHVTHDDKHWSRALLAVIVLNGGNVLVQIGNIIVKLSK
jgi:hypothetical protein